MKLEAYCIDTLRKVKYNLQSKWKNDMFIIVAVVAFKRNLLPQEMYTGILNFLSTYLVMR